MSERASEAVSSPPQPAGTAPTTGVRVLDGRYRLDGELGRGGMATVHRAHDLLLDRDVAVKLFPAARDDADELLRHSAEVRTLATLSHPGLVALFDAGAVHDGLGSQEVYLVMELVDGPTLAQDLRGRRWTAREAALVGMQVADALALVHERDIVHRDIKPGNILLTAVPGAVGPTVKVADFGIARLAGATRLTMTGVTLGTVHYLSPEQVTGSALGPATDVYSLGLVLIEGLAGRPAFSGTIAESAAARLTSSPTIGQDVPPALAQLLARMTATAPDDRPGAAEVARDLARFLADGPDPVSLRATAVLHLPVTEGGPSTAPGAPSGSADSEADSEADEAPPTVRYRRPARRARLAGAVGAVAVVAAAVVVVIGLQDGSAPSSPGPAPTYPSVQGDLGDALTSLQESVNP